jgi:glycerophosphoryl diester phosphodiesterase
MRSSFLDAPTPLAFAHRGGATYPPNVGVENSMAAFRRAIDMGYRYLETDVHATADGVLVAFHDDTLDRVTDRHGLVAELPWAEVSRARIGGREPIPRLEELLEAWPRARLNIDVKAEAAIEPLVDVLARAAAGDRVCVSSFSGRRLRRLRRLLGPDVATSFAPPDVARLMLPLPAWLARAVLVDARCVQVPVSNGRVRIVTPAFVQRAHRLGRHVHVWTVDGADEMRALLDIGVDGLMTDRIDVLRDVLVERGRWPSP